MPNLKIHNQNAICKKRLFETARLRNSGESDQELWDLERDRR
ncbi:hypothetical protein [Phormidesmis priestleyi]|nr:hypothetical protein [Phormidesmis priestleyi]